MASTAALLSTCRRDTVLQKQDLGLTLITDLGFGGQISKLGPQPGKTLSLVSCWCLLTNDQPLAEGESCYFWEHKNIISVISTKNKRVVPNQGITFLQEQMHTGLEGEGENEIRYCILYNIINKLP